MIINFSFLRRKPEARITLEEIGNSGIINEERELKIYVGLKGERDVQLGPYRLADAENIYEAACLLNRYLLGRNFKGNVVICSKTANKSHLLELFQSDLRYAYKLGNVGLDVVSTGVKA